MMQVRREMAKEDSMTNRSMSQMVRDQNPLTLPPETSVQEACRRMRDRGVGAVLVTSPDRHLVGIFTGRDAVCRVLAEGLDPADTSLRDVMTLKPDIMPPRRTAIDALRLMQDGGFRHLPVVDNGQVVGIVSRGDFRGLEQARLDEETGLWERI
jgi:CBS domain-containing protein